MKNENSDREGCLGVVLISAALFLPGALAHFCAPYQPGTLAPSEYSIPFAYTWSLLFYGLPVSLVYGWLWSSKNYRETLYCLHRSQLILIPIGVVMNLVFAGLFFEYPNNSANLGIDVPVPFGTTPLEDYLFYLISFPFVTLTYVWTDKWWLSAYHVNVSGHRGKIRINWPIPCAGIILSIVLAAIYRRTQVDESGFPGYLTYVLIVAVLPASLLFNNVSSQINWRAFGVTHIIMVLVCMEWEATFAMPFGFWGFRKEMMMGIHLSAWHDLPIEQIVVWFASTFVNVVIYELVRSRCQT